MSDHYSMIHYLYQLFYRKFYGNYKYNFEPTENMEKHIVKFLELMDKKYLLESIGINFLLNYFIFQFDYWSKLTIKTYAERIQLNFIIGKAAVDRWKKRDIKFDYKILRSDIIQKYNININEIIQFFKEEELNQLNKSEELNKKRFYNTNKGFLICLTTTTLYYHKSSLCLTCKFKDECKRNLELKFNNIYIERGYGRKKETSIN